MLSILPGIYIDEVKNKGRGVYTHNSIAVDTIIETSPVIVMTETERKLLDQTLLHDYIFEWQPEGQKKCCMAQGYISVYNHSFSSNCEYYMNYEEHTIYIKAVRDIVAGDELTINYNGNWDDGNNVWFDVK